MIKVLHFASIINRFDIIDTILAKLNKTEFDISSLTIVPPKRNWSISDVSNYTRECLDIEFNKNNFFRVFLGLIKKIKLYKPDIIVSHHYQESIITLIIVTFLYPKTRWIIGRHYSNDIYILSKGIRRKIHLTLEKMCNTKADLIYVPSIEVFNLLTRSQKVRKEKVIIIPFILDLEGGVRSDPNSVQTLKDSFNSSGKFMFVTCGRLSKEKGLLYLIEAIKILSKKEIDFIVYLIGEGDERYTIEALIHEYELDYYVKLVGWRNDAYDWMALANCLVHPSLAESFCQVLIESYLLKTPAIITPVGVAPLLLGNTSDAGLLVEIGNIEELANAMEFVIFKQNILSKMVDKGIENIKKHLDINLILRMHESIYYGLVSKNDK